MDDNCHLVKPTDRISAAEKKSRDMEHPASAFLNKFPRPWIYAFLKKSFSEFTSVESHTGQIVLPSS